MNSRMRTLALTLLVMYLVGLLAVFCWVNYGQGLPAEIKRLPEELRPDSTFFIDWLSAEVAVLFVKLLPPLHCAAVLLAFSLFPSVGAMEGGPGGFTRMIGAPLVLFLVLTFGYAVLLEFVLPDRNLAGDAARARASLAAGLYEKGRQAEKAAEPAAMSEARLYFANLKRLVPRSRSVQETLDRLDARIKEAGAEKAAARTAGAPGPLLLNLKEKDLVSRAEAYRKNSDYASVLYYAGLAVRLNEKNLAARRLLNDARARLDKYGETAEEFNRQRLARLKTQAIAFYEETGRLGSDPDRVFESYRRLHELGEEFPEDKDLRLYLEAGAKRLAESHFFFEELPMAADFAAAGAGGAFFLNPVAGLPAGQRELVCFRRLVRAENPGLDGLAYGSFLFDLEVMRIDAAGGLRSHYRAPYARYRSVGETKEGFLQLRCVSRDDPGDRGRMRGPESLPGSPAAAPALAPVAFSEDELYRLAAAEGSLEKAGVGMLLNAVELQRRAGYSERRVQEAVLDRIARPFNLLILSFLALSLGWRLRSRYLSVPKLAALLGVALLPLVAYLAMELWDYVQASFVGFALYAWGFAAGSSVLIGLEALLFAGALLLLAARFKDR